MIRKLSIQKQVQRTLPYLIVLSTILILTNCSKDDDENQAKPTSEVNIFYQEFVVDTTNYENDTISYDINDDTKLDLQLTKSIKINQSDIKYSGTIGSIHDSIMYCYIRTEPNWTMLDFGYEIHNSSIYNWKDFILYTGITPFISDQHYWASGVFTDYFGFQFIKDNNTYFGWFRMKHFRIAEIAINITPNSPITVGQTK